ncbi:MAG: flagellar hook-length control protein FliK [Alphaproteobacteria bacterium]
MDLSISSAQDRTNTQTPGSTTQPVPGQGDSGAFAAILQQNSFRFGGMSGLPFVAKTLATAIDKPQPVAQPDRPAPTQSDSKASGPSDGGNARDTSRVQSSGRTDNRQRKAQAASDDDAQTQAAPDDSAVRADKDASRSETRNDAKADTRESSPQTDDRGGSDANQTALEANEAVQSVVASVQIRAMNDNAVKISQFDESGSGDNGQDADAMEALLSGAPRNQGLVLTTSQQGGNASTATLQVDENAQAEDDSSSLFAFKLNLQSGASLFGRFTGAKTASNGPVSAKNSEMQAQAADLSQMLGAGERLAVTVATQAEVTRMAPQSASSLVPSALLAGSGLDDMVRNGTLPGTPSQLSESQGGQGKSPEALAAMGAQATGETLSTPVESSLTVMPTSSFAETLSGVAAASSEGNQGTQTGSQSVSSDKEAGLPQVGATQGTSKSSEAQGAQASQQARAPHQVQTPIPVEQVKVSIGQALADGTNHISIQLTPEQLGRIEVHLDVGQNGQVQATITADKPETLALLRQDSSGMERALQDAGLKPDADSLSFNLRGDGQSQGWARENGGGENNNGTGNRGSHEPAVEELEQRLQAARTASERLTALRGGVDVSI